MKFWVSLRRVLSFAFRPDLFRRKQLKMTIIYECSWVTAVLIAFKGKSPSPVTGN